VACLVGLAGLVAIDRNRVLSTITRMPKGAINLNWALARRVVVFAIIPLLSVVAAQFPELGATVLNLLGPMQEALF
jgi:hypothetical protein